MEDWDISHLEMRQNSNAKSLEEDCLKIIGKKQHRNDEGHFWYDLSLILLFFIIASITVINKQE